MNGNVFLNMAKAMQLAENGVDYSHRHGARCPWCKSRIRIYRTMSWDGKARVRYHRCERSGCMIASMRMSIKSIEIDREQP